MYISHGYMHDMGPHYLADTWRYNAPTSHRPCISPFVPLLLLPLTVCLSSSLHALTLPLLQLPLTVRQHPSLSLTVSTVCLGTVLNAASHVAAGGPS